jgi:hypothetical protein
MAHQLGFLILFLLYHPHLSLSVVENKSDLI